MINLQEAIRKLILVLTNRKLALSFDQDGTQAIHELLKQDSLSQKSIINFTYDRTANVYKLAHKMAKKETCTEFTEHWESNARQYRQLKIAKVYHKELTQKCLMMSCVFYEDGNGLLSFAPTK